MMRRGYFVNYRSGVLSQAQEADIDTCAHCGTVLFLHPVPGKTCWTEDGAFCRSEMKRLCGPCGTRALTFGCEPQLKQIENIANATMKFEHYLKIAGLEPPPSPRPLILASG